MTGLKPGDKVGAKIYGEWCAVRVVKEGAQGGACVLVEHKDGSTHNRSTASLIPVEKLLSMAEEILGTQEDTLPEYIYITKSRHETGCAVPIGTKLKVIGEADGPVGSLEVEGPSGENWWVEPAWYTTEEPVLPKEEVPF